MIGLEENKLSYFAKHIILLYPNVTPKPVLSRWGIFIAIAKFIDFYFMPNIIRILSKDHVL